MLDQCLASIKKHEPSLLQYTYVVDDASPMPNTQDHLLKLNNKYGNKSIFRPTNSGYSVTVNRGLKWLEMKKVEAVLTLNSDCEVTTPFLESVTKIFRYDPLITVIGARLLYPSGKIQSAGQTVPKAGYVQEHHKMLYPHDNTATGKPCYVHSVTGAMQFFRTTAGVYDERFKMAYEDVEFCMRQWEAGKRVFYQPQIQGIHREGATRGRFPSARELESIDVFDECRRLYALDEHHKTIDELNRKLQ